MLTPERINEMANGVDHHLRCLETYVETMRQSKIALEELKAFKEVQFLAELKEIKQEIKTLTEILQNQGIITKGLMYENGLAMLRALFETDEWPAAVNAEAICDNQDKEDLRAQGIVDLVLAEYFKGVKFLDYGCGRGNVAAIVAKNEAAKSVGYDVKSDWRLSKSDWRFNPPDNLLFTTNLDEVKQNAPYDIILAYDVLDHCVIDPLLALTQIRDLTKPDSRVYVRNHPWCSRHGGHLYLQKNKAFAHLVFDEVELERMCGISSPDVIKIYTPSGTYKDWFGKAGFAIKRENILNTPVEEFFFSNVSIRKKLKSYWGDTYSMRENMSVDFADYLLEPNHANVAVF